MKRALVDADDEERAAVRVVALVVVHNRLRYTLQCLKQLYGEESGALTVDVVLVDDGSTDGTRSVVSRTFPRCQIVAGTGSLFWGGSMHLGENSAGSLAADYLLWVNNDCDLESGFLTRLVEAAQQKNDQSIVCGALTNEFGRVTYGGYRLVGRRFGLLRMERMKLTKALAPIDTFNGNLVLIPRRVAVCLRGVDRRFPHRYGDLDYGLRARSYGISAFVLPGSVGRCDRNDARGTFLDPSLNFRGRVRSLVSPKGHPLKARWLYLRRHGGRLWPAQWFAFYLVRFGEALLARSSGLNERWDTGRSHRKGRRS